MIGGARQVSTASLLWALFLSSFCALVLTIVQLPQWLFYFRPDWIALIIVYWALMVSDRVGPFVGFIIGTMLEVLFVRTFGVLGLGLATLAFIVNGTHQQLKALSVWQQTILVGVFIAVYKLLTGWLSGIVSDFTFTGEYWYSILGSMLVWPFVFILLQELRRIVRVN